MRWQEQMRQAGVRKLVSAAHFSTGWWGRPGDKSLKGFTKVHLYKINTHGPACGAGVGKDMIYQWCSPGIKWDYLECENCKRIARKFLDGLKVNPSEWA